MTEASLNDYDKKDQRVLDSLMPYSSKVKKKNLTEVSIQNVVRKSSICLIVMPQWAIDMVPYNIAKLAAITKEAGYKTYAFDLNIKSYLSSKNWNLDFDPWDFTYNYKWLQKDVYYKNIHELLIPLMDEYIDKIVELNPTVLGFSMYDPGHYPTKYMVEKLKQRLPNVLIAVGGPACHRGSPNFDFHIDYIVSGEGEQLILDMLEEVEAGNIPVTARTFRQEIGQRINLDALPPPDYSHFDFNDYKMPNGVTMEFSRGCVAKCAFCDETHFWKYRDRDVETVLAEIKRLNDLGVTNFWFLDSLVNGNLKQLRAFAKGIVENKLTANWAGWARCDDRMDDEYFKDLSASGCRSLSFGVESGSNKVLELMAKGITNSEIEANLQLCKKYNILVSVMLIFGFPGEEPIDFYDTMTLFWRSRNTNVGYYSTGLGCLVAENNILGQNKEKFNIHDLVYGNEITNWIAKDYSNSKLHRLIRVKTFNILMSNTNRGNTTLTYMTRPALESHYKLSFDNNVQNDVDYEVFDFNICKPNINPFADSLVNEIWPLLRILYRSRGAYSIEIEFDGEKDKQLFSTWLGDKLSAIIKFKIDNDGNWDADFKFEYKQLPDCWRYEYYENIESNALKRIQILSDKKEYTGMNRQQGIQLAREYNQTMDFSFNYHYKNTGKW